MESVESTHSEQEARERLRLSPITFGKEKVSISFEELESTYQQVNTGIERSAPNRHISDS